MNDSVKKYYETYDYSSRTPVEINLDSLRPDQSDRLIKNNVFCMLPWIHLHAWPTGEAYPCCIFDDKSKVGSLRDNSMSEIWNNESMRQIRQDMLNETPVKGCSKCYDQEEKGLFSMRNSSNKHFGHHIADVDKTAPDGTHPEFKIRYWDVRFSNICNFRCRYCGPNFSSNWWEDKAAMYGKENMRHTKFQYAGKHKNDIWEQMQPHLPYIEQVYFAGGEPLIMDEHYKLLELLIEQGRTDVRLIYNTNFSELVYKRRDVLEMWKHFSSVSIGASLDGMGARGEYMRKGTVWSEIEDNRRRMLEVCPNVDFYVSSTVSIFNVMHVSDFHMDWVNKGLIKAQDWNINVLYGPDFHRCDVLPSELKQIALEKLNKTIDWLYGQDHLQRATNGYKGLINFMMGTDNSKLIPEFFRNNDKLDTVRKETFEEIFPELRNLRDFI